MDDNQILIKFKDEIIEILRILSEKDFKRLKDKGYMGRLTQLEILKTLEDFHCQYITLPEEVLANLIPIKVNNKTTSNCWYLDIDLWCNGEKSDLTLSLLLEEKAHNNLTIQIQDLHVL